MPAAVIWPAALQMQFGAQPLEPIYRAAATALTSRGVTHHAMQSLSECFGVEDPPPLLHGAFSWPWGRRAVVQTKRPCPVTSAEVCQSLQTPTP
jgi:hypothetical protein